MRCLINATGWIGDTLFATSLPEKLKKELGFTTVDFVTHRLQPWLLLKAHPYIDNLYYLKSDNPDSFYDKVFTLPSIEDKGIAPTIQFQKFCGVKNVSTEFQVYTDKQMDKAAEIFARSLSTSKEDIITYQGDWDYRLWQPSDLELATKTWDKTGMYVYFRSLRPIDFKKFIAYLKTYTRSKTWIEISPFKQPGEQSADSRGYSSDPFGYALNASIIKQSGLFIGAEGGLSNLAAGLGVKCIITTDHMDRMFGKDGFMSRCKDVQLGPAKLFPNKGHIHLDPFLSIPDLTAQIVRLIKGLDV